MQILDILACNYRYILKHAWHILGEIFLWGQSRFGREK